MTAADEYQRALTKCLMRAMGCKVEYDDIPEGPCCEFPPACRGHERVWFCTEHDWHEDDNAEGVCGYALMLAQALAADPGVRAAVEREARAEARLSSGEQTGDDRG